MLRVSHFNIIRIIKFSSVTRIKYNTWCHFQYFQIFYRPFIKETGLLIDDEYNILIQFVLLILVELFLFFYSVRLFLKSFHMLLLHSSFFDKKHRAETIKSV